MSVETQAEWQYAGWSFPSTERLIQTTCWCGIRFAIPDNLHRWLHDDSRRECYCPAGHKMHYSDGLEQQLQRERQRSGRLAAQRDQAEASRRAQKGATTKAKKRHANGVCPACKRSFANVRRHMENKHPDYDPRE